jgi:ferredoxin-NADP reductase
MSQRETFPVRVIESRPLASDVRHLALEIPGIERFQFVAGQYVCLSIPLEDGVEDRYYSIASPPRGDNRFELCVATSDNAGGRALAALVAGDELLCWGPGGHFALRDPLRDSLFIGTGTGVAPLRSMILSILNAPHRDEKRIALLLGARTPEKLLYRDEMERLASDVENFDFWPTLTRADGGWLGRRGRVLVHLADALSGRHNETDVYLCGQPEMVSEVREQLLSAGLDEDALFYEKY